MHTHTQTHAHICKAHMQTNMQKYTNTNVKDRQREGQAGKALRDPGTETETKKIVYMHTYALTRTHSMHTRTGAGGC